MITLEDLEKAQAENDVAAVERLCEAGVIPQATDFIIAIKKNQTPILTLYLKYGIENVEKQNYWGFTPMTQAIKLRNREAMNLLLADGVSPNMESSFGPPLNYAAMKGLKEEAILLIEAGANLEQCDSNQNTPLICAARFGRLEIAEILLKAGANPLSLDILGRTAYEIAVEEKELALMQLLGPLSSGKIVPEKTPLELLLQCIDNGDESGVETCLASGVDVNGMDKLGRKPLEQAIEKNSTKLVKRLLKAGANASDSDTEGSTWLDIAVFQLKIEIAEVLFKAGARLSFPDGLVFACLVADERLFKLFLKAGHDVNERSPSGETPLMKAAGKLALGIAKTLLIKGARQDLADDSGWTALFYAVFSTSYRTVSEQLPNGAKITTGVPLAPSPDNPSVLSILELLIGQGADVNHRDKKGRTPLMIATNQRVVDYLIQAGASLDSKDKQKHDVFYWFKRNGISLDDTSKRQKAVARPERNRRPRS